MTWISGWLPGWTGAWFGPEQAQPAGAMTFYVSGYGTFSAPVLARGFAAVTFAGSSSLVASLVAGVTASFTAEGSGTLAAAATGRGRVSLSVGGTGSVTASLINGNAGPSYANMTVAMAGTGTVQAALSDANQADVVATGAGARGTFHSLREQRRFAFGELQIQMAGVGSLNAEIHADKRVLQDAESLLLILALAA